MDSERISCLLWAPAQMLELEGPLETPGLHFSFPRERRPRGLSFCSSHTAVRGGLEHSPGHGSSGCALTASRDVWTARGRDSVLIHKCTVSPVGIQTESTSPL